MPLVNQSQNQTLATHVLKASSFFQRAKGLLGREFLEEGTTMHIKDCSSIHTFFMKFAIDVIFVDRNHRVTSVYLNVKPWRLVVPFFGAQSVYEFAAGAIAPGTVQKGDQLHVSS